MKFQTTLGLLLLLAGIGAYFLLVESKIESGRDIERRLHTQTKLDGTALFTADAFSTESVVSIRVERPGQEAVVLSKQGTRWFQTQPVRFALKEWSVRQIIDSAAELRYTSRHGRADEGDGPTLAEASLDTALATVTFYQEQQGADAGGLVIRLGGQSLGGSGFAMRGDDGPVLVVNDDLHKVVLKEGVKDWRSQTVKLADEGLATRVGLYSDSESVQMVKVDGVWTFVGQGAGRADREKVGDLLRDVGGIYVEEFVADRPGDLGAYGLDKPTVRLVVSSPDLDGGEQEEGQLQSEVAATQPAGGDKTRELLVGAETGLVGKSHFAAWISEDDPADVVVLKISDADRQKLVRSVEDFRDPRVTPVEVGDVRELAIERGDQGKIRFVHTPDGWEFGGDGVGFDADSGLVSMLVDAVIGWKAERFTSRAYIDDGQEVATLSLGVIGSGGEETLQVYRHSESEDVVVFRKDEAVGYVVAQAQMGRVFDPAISFRDRALLDVAIDEVVSIGVRNSFGAVYEFVRGEDQGKGWLLEGQQGFESEDFERLMMELFPLECERWIGSGAEDGTDGAVSAVVVIRTADEDEHRLEIKLDGRVGRLDGVEDQFVIEQSLLGLIETEFRDRVVLPLEIDQIAKVTVVKGRRAVTVLRDEKGGYALAEGDGLVEAAVAGVFDQLSPLNVVRYLEPEDRGDPSLVYEIMTSGEQTFRVELYDDDNVVRVGDRWGVIGVQAAERLRAQLVEGEQADEAEADGAQ